MKLIFSSTDDKLRKELLELSDPTEEQLVNKARSYENAQFNISTMQSGHAARKILKKEFDGNCGACLGRKHKPQDCKKRQTVMREEERRMWWKRTCPHSILMSPREGKKGKRKIKLEKQGQIPKEKRS